MRVRWVSFFILFIFPVACVYGEIEWDRKITLGYNKSNGNTDSSQLATSLFINKKREHVDELTLKGSLYYSSSDRKMDAQRWDSSIRYAFSFGNAKKWYNFYKTESDHDRFANIDYRITPSTGLGYWLYDLPELKAMAEVAVGLEQTEYRNNAEDSEEWILIPRAFFGKQLFKTLKLSEDLYLYPAFDDFSDYRLRSETVFTNSITDELSLNVSLIDDYDSEPAGDTKKNDLRFITSLSYSF